MAQPTDLEIVFGPFRLDRANARLLRDGRPVALTPKSFDVLFFLASRPERLVTKDELLSAVWSDVAVTDASVKVCVREIRKALGDSPQCPKYIETVHRRGYRFVGRAPEDERPQGPGAASLPARPAASHFVGRGEELRRLAEGLALAAGGARQVVFVAGGPGGGKTALVEAFLDQARRAYHGRGLCVAAGHCFEQFGTSDPYMPVWEALGRLERELPGGPLAPLLARHVAAEPTPAAREPRTLSQRMLREMADALEALAADAPLVLVLEDLHWADYSTLDLVSALARRQGGARLMLVGTYRPGDAASDGHPLRAVVPELLAKGLACEMRLAPLDEPAVSSYLAARLAADVPPPPPLARRLHQRTQGHALFLVKVVDDLIEQGALSGEALSGGAVPGGADWASALDASVPGSVRSIIEAQLDHATAAEQRVLEAAAVAGVEFSSAAVAAALGDDPVATERACDELTRRNRFIEIHGVSEWPDGTLATGYRFLHAMYHEVVYGRVPAARRAALHRELGLRLESAWALRAGENAVELAMHFERGRDWRRAVPALRLSADRATRQYAHREAVDLLRRALATLEHLPAAERSGHELTLLMSFAVQLQVTRGFAAPEVREVHARAYGLCLASGDTDVRTAFPVLWGIWLFHKVRSELREAEPLVGRLLSMAREAGDDALLLQAHQAACVTYLCLGNPAVTREHMAQAAAVYDPRRHAANTHQFGQDPGVACQAFGAVALWLLGEAEEALRASARALGLARELAQPSTLSVALHFAAMLHQCRGDADAVERHASESAALAAEEGFSFWSAGAQMLRGWATAVRGDDAGVEQIRRGLDAWLATGSRTYHAYFLGLLADALLRHGRPGEALEALGQGIEVARSLPEGLWEAELYRLEGRCLLEVSPAPGASRKADAENCFAIALETARRQNAKALEARVLLDLRPPRDRPRRTPDARYV
jgi:DNA-binding winged helix-turn-helix (wHTH) protein/predicted ATPase